MESFCFAQAKKAVFISIRYHKTSQTQVIKSQSTKRSVRKLKQPKRDPHLNKKQVLFQVERSEEVLKTTFLLQPKKQAHQSSRRHFWNVLNVVLENFGFEQETAVFKSFRYHKTYQTQFVNSQSTKPSLRKKAQPKRESAFEQETRFVPSRETSGSSQKIFLVTTN